MSASRELLGSVAGEKADHAAWPLLAAALDASGDGLLIVRMAPDAPNIVFANRVFGELTGYGSAEWLRDFLRDPGKKRFYGSHNAMPSFGERLTGQELEFVIKWLLHDWPEPAQD